MDFDYSTGYHPRACRRCKLLKRKCDKAFPKCSSCCKSRGKCLYPGIQDTSSVLEHPAHSTPSAALRDISIRPSGSEPSRVGSGFPPIYFLDFELFQRAIAEIPKVITGIRPELKVLTEDIREQANTYFCTIHPWIPFLSKKFFNERLLSPLAPRGTDISLLFACIKLVCSVPMGESMHSSAYITIKGSLLEAEMAGVVSLRILQAWILLCIYEFGHAIYPSAYLSVGICARYAAALGINFRESKSQRQTYHWIEAEERARALWAVVILDRFLNLGCQIPSLSTEDPSGDTHLPIDDVTWDRGLLNDDHAGTVSTPPTPLMGRFVLTAMATNLLGQVIRLIRDPEYSALHSSEAAAILDRALTALTTVAREEGMSRGVGVCTPTVFCHSARILLILHKQRQERHIEEHDNAQGSEIIRLGIASDLVRLSQRVTSKSGQPLNEELSPFALYAAYRTVVAYLEEGGKNSNGEHLHGLQEIKSLLTLSSKRWKLGGVYLKLIEAREAVYSSVKCVTKAKVFL
ncbi:hypothetical protein EJ08DRAFT_210869 [Tothia fuscella]|uniref:Zn(2)-C6 fungal-type domain-containing protein n=1 Tax=Tothia fuscella TaxID=1048955 RepID=A0A9P4TZD9_9PEZI|nr:hypothetical protein EJ08DRAFT_210869 [Tothia fuscella]